MVRPFLLSFTFPSLLRYIRHSNTSSDVSPGVFSNLSSHISLIVSLSVVSKFSLLSALNRDLDLDEDADAQAAPLVHHFASEP